MSVSRTRSCRRRRRAAGVVLGWNLYVQVRKHSIEKLLAFCMDCVLPVRTYRVRLLVLALPSWIAIVRIMTWQHLLESTLQLGDAWTTCKEMVVKFELASLAI
jgi:hypothetical protein